jgi:hypothetical protein
MISKKRKYVHHHKRKHTRKVKTVVLPKVGVLRIEAHPETKPVVVAKAPGIVDVISVPKKLADDPSEMGWLEYLFGR